MGLVPLPLVRRLEDEVAGEGDILGQDHGGVVEAVRSNASGRGHVKPAATERVAGGKQLDRHHGHRGGQGGAVLIVGDVLAVPQLL